MRAYFDKIYQEGFESFAKRGMPTGTQGKKRKRSKEKTENG